jgi:hypothetical protein
VTKGATHLRAVASAVLEIAGAAAVTIGIHITLGPGPALVAGGMLAVIFGVALDGPIRRRRR